MKALATVLLAVTGAVLASSQAVAGPEPPVALAATNAAALAAARTLDGIEARIERMERDVQSLRSRASARARAAAALDAPPSLARKNERWRSQIDATLLPLRGQPWTAVEPLIQRATRLRGRLVRLEEQLAAPIAPRLRPPKQSGLLPPGSGRISGRVSDALTGAAIDAWVELYDLSGTYLDYSETQGGSYAFDSLPTGTYFLTASSDSGNGYTSEVFDDIPCDWYCDVTDGTPVVVLDGQTRSGVDFGLTPFSAISGAVLDASTERPLRDVEVRLYDTSGYWVDYSYSGPDGRYVFEGLTQGLYFAVAESPYYLDQLYQGLPCQPDCNPGAGTPILVGPGMQVANIDFRMQLGGSISGRVTDEPGDAPLPSLYVDVYGDDGTLVDYASTGATGHYQVFDLPAGTYFARTSSYGDYDDELFDDIPCEPSCTVTSGTPIVVTIGQERGAVDFALQPAGSGTAGSLSGAITDALSGAPVSGVYVAAVDAAGGWAGGDTTSSAGFYRVQDLGSGSYFVYTSSSTHVDQLFDGFPCDPSCVPTAGTPVAVTAGNDTPGIGFQLNLGGWLAGRVTAAASGAPLSYATVSVYRSDGTSATSVSTDEDGRYVSSGLVSGTYFARASSNAYEPELYSELPCPSGCDPTSGTPISVTTAAGTLGIDFTLASLTTGSGAISGRVTELGSGLPVRTYLEVYNSSGTQAGYAYSGSSGHYLVSGLATGSYFVRTITSTYSNVVDELYDNRTCEPDCDVTQGTPVAVTMGATTSGIDFVLRPPTFADVPLDHWAWRWVETVAMAGIAGGCGSSPPRFCPDATVTRAQSSVFLLRAKEGSSYVPPPATGVFSDVPATDPFAAWIEELARRGVAGGCRSNPPAFCPGSAVTRAQSAPLLLRTLEGPAYTPPDAVGVFQDVPPADPFARWIEELARRGVTGGCSTQPPLFCPGQSLTRAQVAVFLVKAFGLVLP